MASQSKGAQAQGAPGALNGVRVIDLAADFRLKDLATFEKWYGMPHSCPEVLEESVYSKLEYVLVRLRFSCPVPGRLDCCDSKLPCFLPVDHSGQSMVSPGERTRQD